MSKFVAEEYQQARDALADARILLEGGGSDEAVVNRLYYACFHAASAVLISKDHEVASHRGLIMVFGREVVLTGDVPKDDGRFLNELNDLREQADYGYDKLDVAVKSLYERAEDFVDHAESVIEQHDEDAET